jgi:hypothetical protein
MHPRVVVTHDVQSAKLQSGRTDSLGHHGDERDWCRLSRKEREGNRVLARVTRVPTSLVMRAVRLHAIVFVTRRTVVVIAMVVA